MGAGGAEALGRWPRGGSSVATACACVRRHQFMGGDPKKGLSSEQLVGAKTNETGWSSFAGVPGTTEEVGNASGRKRESEVELSLEAEAYRCLAAW